MGYSHNEIYELVYMTSGVKCPSNTLETSHNYCQAYLEDEVKQYDPSIVITAGAKATKWTAGQLGITSKKRDSVRISKPEWWGFSSFETNPPMIHAPHWSYYDIYCQLTDNEWEQVITEVQEGLRTLGFEGSRSTSRTA